MPLCVCVCVRPWCFLLLLFWSILLLLFVLFCFVLCWIKPRTREKVYKSISGSRQFSVNSAAHQRCLPSLCLQLSQPPFSPVWLFLAQLSTLRDMQFFRPKRSKAKWSCLYPTAPERALHSRLFFPCPIQELLHYLIGTLLLLIASIVAASKSYNQSGLVAGAVRCF